MQVLVVETGMVPTSEEAARLRSNLNEGADRRSVAFQLWSVPSFSSSLLIAFCGPPVCKPLSRPYVPVDCVKILTHVRLLLSCVADLLRTIQEADEKNSWQKLAVRAVPPWQKRRPVLFL